MIELKVMTKKRNTLKLLNNLNSYLFEEIYGELSNVDPKSIAILREASKVLSKIVSNG